MLCLLTMLSCRSQYAVTGSSSVDELEGKMLTLKVFADGEMRSIDSTRVVHGKFNFGGGMDSTMLMKSRLSMKRMASSFVPFRPKAITPQVPFGMYF